MFIIIFFEGYPSKVGLDWGYFKPRPIYSPEVNTPAEVNIDATRTTAANMMELQTNRSSALPSVASTTAPKTTAAVAETAYSTTAFFTSKLNPVTGFPYEHTEAVTTSNNLSPTGISTPLQSSTNTDTKKFKCAGVSCFKYVNATEEPCKVKQNFCELKRTYRQVTWIEYRTSWRAGCSANCRDAAPCFSPYKYRCHQECCQAGATSCLKLDGSLHVPSSGVPVTLSSPLLLLLLSLTVPSLAFGLLALASLQLML
ncbi:hypothetical protein ACEWY4_024366 [Coilia grayii]|uniref:Uncharacterized protein n=1 Tax=Coilia grayii TaxID=363190 RepID=A0ABD1J049_9TELE